MIKRIFLIACGCMLLSMFALTAPKRPQLLGVAHMALYVSELEKTRSFYRDFLGLQEPFTARNADGTVHTTFFKVNENQYIELIPGLKPEQDRLNHIAFQTDNLKALYRYLAARGIKPTTKITAPRADNASFMVKDADDHLVEFIEYAPTRWTRREQGKFLGNNPISTRILHVGILVGDAPVATKFYTDILGLQEFWRGSARDAKTVSWLNMRLPESNDYVEFMLYTQLPPPTQRGSQHHICLEVPNIERALAQLEASPYRKQYTRPLEIRTGINRRRQLNLFDPDGTRIELMEPRTIDGLPPAASTLPLPRKNQGAQ